MGMLVMPLSQTDKVTSRKMGRKDSKGTTPRIGIKHLEKVRPCTAIKASWGDDSGQELEPYEGLESIRRPPSF